MFNDIFSLNGWHSDLACERRKADASLPGVSFSEERLGNIRIERIVISSPEGEKSVGRPIGRYDTLFLPEEEDDASVTVLAISTELLRMIPHAKRLLFVGLGNRVLTPDAVGPWAADRVNATSHLTGVMPDLFERLRCAEISVISPGVSGCSGLDAADVVRAVCKLRKPDAVVAVDALATSDSARLGNTVQFCDTGIFPGGGIGNRRKALNRETLGVPVIGIGVPTVIDSRVFLAEDASRRGIPLPDGLFDGEPLFLSPRTVDETVRRVADRIGTAFNAAFGIPDAT